MLEETIDLSHLITGEQTETKMEIDVVCIREKQKEESNLAWINHRGQLTREVANQDKIFLLIFHPSWCPSIYPFSVNHCVILIRVERCAGDYPNSHWVWGRNTPWLGRQSRLMFLGLFLQQLHFRLHLLHCHYNFASFFGSCSFYPKQFSTNGNCFKQMEGWMFIL